MGFDNIVKRLWDIDNMMESLKFLMFLCKFILKDMVRDKRSCVVF